MIFTRRGSWRTFERSNETLEAVEPWEFQTRLGVEPDEFRRLRAESVAILGSIGRLPQT